MRDVFALRLGEGAGLVNGIIKGHVRLVLAARISRRSSEVLLLVVVAGVLLSACERTSSVAGVYVFERSSVVTARDNETDCGLPGMPSLADDATFAVRGPKGEEVEVLETISECVFPARLDGDTILAADVECSIAPDAVVRRTWGLYQKRYLSFRIDTRRGTLNENTASWQTLQQGTVHSCATSEGRLVRFTADEDDE